MPKIAGAGDLHMYTSGQGTLLGKVGPLLITIVHMDAKACN